MPMNFSVLADEIKEGLGHGKEKTSKEAQGMAKAIIAELQQNGLVSIAPPGLTGTAPPSGGPLVLGKAVGGKILAILGPSLASRMQLEMGFPTITKQLAQTANNLVTHFSTAGEVIFDPGGIVGVCTNTPTSPGPLTGAGSKGKIAGLVPDTLAPLLASGLGNPVTEEITNLAKAIINHIQGNAEVTLVSGSVTGVCASGGGPLQAGTASGGRIF